LEILVKILHAFPIMRSYLR